MADTSDYRLFLSHYERNVLAVLVSDHLSFESCMKGRPERLVFAVGGDAECAGPFVFMLFAPGSKPVGAVRRESASPSYSADSFCRKIMVFLSGTAGAGCCNFKNVRPD